jgi:cation transport regulator
MGAWRAGAHPADVPYDRLAELPPSVRRVLPKHAQEIYRKAFNNAWDEYRSPGRRREEATREETAHRVAWAAVKAVYRKDASGGRWRRRRR